MGVRGFWTAQERHIAGRWVVSRGPDGDRRQWTQMEDDGKKQWERRYQNMSASMRSST